jgi:hypothetical protein
MSNYTHGIFIPFRKSLSGGVSWYNKTESHRQHAAIEARAKGMSSGTGITNAELAKDANFIKACAKAGIPATSRQASKFRRKYGQVYKVHKGG